jgi:hypothetical protein
MNQFVLTDEEDAEYHAFETMIATHDAFCSLLCTFHAVWQPFNSLSAMDGRDHPLKK